MPQADVLLTMRPRTPARWMSPFVSESMVFLVALIALVEPEPLRRIQVVHAEVSPGVTYRIERHWRLASAEVEVQSEDAFASLLSARDMEIPYRRYPGRWHDGMSTAWEDLKRPVHDHLLRQRLRRLYCEVPNNWYLCDVGVSRNGQPLRLPADLATHLVQRHAQADREWRAWPAYNYENPSENDEIGAQSIAELMARARESDVRLGTFEIGVDTCGQLEVVVLRPYVLFLTAGTVIGVVGGDGRFDHVPDELNYLR